MSKLAVPVAFIFSRDALDTYARSTVRPAESALPRQASYVEHQPPRACILRPRAGCRGVTTHLRPPAVEVAAWVGLQLTCGYDGARGAGSAESRGAAGAVGPAG